MHNLVSAWAEFSLNVTENNLVQILASFVMFCKWKEEAKNESIGYVEDDVNE